MKASAASFTLLGVDLDSLSPADRDELKARHIPPAAPPHPPCYPFPRGKTHTRGNRKMEFYDGLT